MFFWLAAYHSGYLFVESSCCEGVWLFGCQLFSCLVVESSLVVSLHIWLVVDVLFSWLLTFAWRHLTLYLLLFVLYSPRIDTLTDVLNDGLIEDRSFLGVARWHHFSASLVPRVVCVRLAKTIILYAKLLFNHESFMGITKDVGTVGGCVYAVSLMLDSFYLEACQLKFVPKAKG